MSTPRIAVLAFPGNNCEVESLRAIRASGMEAVYFRWNDDRALLRDIDGYFFPGGFSYEDRGRSGMVAARDPLLEFVGREADAGKAVIGNCNGAQILIESGLVPVDGKLRMSLAHNRVETPEGATSPGFISEWVWITPACGPDRCATSHWTGAMHVPIAHGEGRFTSVDPDVFQSLQANDQLAFRYCDEAGNISDAAPITPNGSALALAGICNPAGNVVALMPHPERTPLGKPYFDSLQLWITQRKRYSASTPAPAQYTVATLQADVSAPAYELFIDTLIVNNEERTTEQALRRVHPDIRLKQWQYYGCADLADIRRRLSDLTVFNANKQRASIRHAGQWHGWNGSDLEPMTVVAASPLQLPKVLRIDRTSSTTQGTCYGVRGSGLSDLSTAALEVLGNPHASTLHRLA